MGSREGSEGKSKRELVRYVKHRNYDLPVSTTAIAKFKNLKVTATECTYCGRRVDPKKMVPLPRCHVHIMHPERVHDDVVQGACAKCMDEMADLFGGSLFGGSPLVETVPYHRRKKSESRRKNAKK